ncbi:hypothetical protein ACHQM5_001877 [Ranunculus cassubicifolius]
MAKFTLPLVLIISLFALFSIASSVSIQDSKSVSFIKSSCNVTLYPTLCVQSLSIFSSTIQTSPRTMAQTALAVSLSSARTANKFIVKISKSKQMKKREYLVVQDCIVNLGSCLDSLTKSMSELGNMGHGESFIFHMSNVQTWVSAALTDENTCMDGFAGKAMDGRLKSSIKSRLTNVAKVTSNALALVNRFANEQLLS